MQQSRHREQNDWKRVQEIGVWLQCFAVFVGVVAKFVPEVVPGFMAYMVSIIRASQEYEGAAWVAYDAAFRWQAAATCGPQDGRLLCAGRGGRGRQWQGEVYGNGIADPVTRGPQQGSEAT